MSSFHEIVGQRRPIQILQSFLKSKAVPNALLFSGEDGIGKRSTATIFIRTLLCQNPTDGEDGINPCNNCLSCKKLDHGNHPDFFMIAPPADGKPSGAISIDAIRTIKEKMVFEPMDGKWKAMLIVPAEKMTPEAQNSLLKILEEPPHYGLLLLVSSKPSLLIPTILSRCQKITFSPLSLSQIESILMEKKGWSVADARLVAAFTGGKLGEALSLSVEAARLQEEELNALVREETVSHYDTLFEVAVSFSSDLEKLEKALYYLSAYFRDLLVLLAVADSASIDPSLLVFSWRREELLRWAGRMNTHEVGKFLADVTAIQQGLIRNINRQLVLETLLMQMRDKLVTS